MNVSLVQMDIVWSEAEANRRCAEHSILAHPGSDLYLLPEMWSTGYLAQPVMPTTTTGAESPGEVVLPPVHPAIESACGPTLRWMHDMARRMDAAIAGSIAVQAEDGTLRNRFYFVTPDDCIRTDASGNETSTSVYYDKHHLFTYGGEHRHYAPGAERVIVTWRGVRFRLLTCYDLRFPGWARNAAPCPDAEPMADGATRRPTALYDCLLYVASWPATRIAAWQTLLQARAIENQCYVCGVNRVGHDPQCSYSGASAIVDAYGRTLCQAADGAPAVLTATLDLQRLDAFRQKFPVLLDAD